MDNNAVIRAQVYQSTISNLINENIELRIQLIALAKAAQTPVSTPPVTQSEELTPAETPAV